MVMSWKICDTYGQEAKKTVGYGSRDFYTEQKGYRPNGKIAKESWVQPVDTLFHKDRHKPTLPGGGGGMLTHFGHLEGRSQIHSYIRR